MAGRIPPHFIDELLARTDIVDIVDARVPLKKAGKNYQACCPFHDEKTPSFTVSPDKQFYHCFGCGAHGTAIGFLMQYDRLEFRDAVRELAQRAGLPLPAEAQGGPADESAPLYEILAQAARFYQRQLREHADAPLAVEYLKRRGLTGEIAQRYGLGFAPESWDALTRTFSDAALLLKAGLVTQKSGGGHYDRFRRRIMFPIKDARGRVIGFGGRIIDKPGAASDHKEPKYLNSPETQVFHKGTELYGLYEAREAISRAGFVLVVEGYMDVVALAQFGVDNAVATLGTATTHPHLERLFRYTAEVVFCFDGDRAGRAAAWRALEHALALMSDGRQVGFLFLPEGEDPDTFVRVQGPEAFLAAARKPVPLPDFLFQSLAAQVDLGRMDGRARLVSLAQPLLAKLPAGALKELMTARLAEISRVNPEKLSTLMRTPEAVGHNAPTAKPRLRTQSTTSGRPTLVGAAISLLLQDPSLARTVPKPASYAGLELRGVRLLVELLEAGRAEPPPNTAAILERYRDTPYAETLARLAARSVPAHLDIEFHDAIKRLDIEVIRQALNLLSSKERSGGLSDDEKMEFRRLNRELGLLSQAKRGN